MTLTLDVFANEGHSLATHDPYLPQKFDLGIGVGGSWTTSNYILIEGYAGIQMPLCGFHCFQYLDISERVGAQSGQTIYVSSAGWRFQKYFDDSSWGPYLRPFVGISHNLNSNAVQDFGLGGLAIGTYYYLHPAFDARFELGQTFGQTAWTFLTVGVVVKFRNI